MSLNIATHVPAAPSERNQTIIIVFGSPVTCHKPKGGQCRICGQKQRGHFGADQGDRSEDSIQTIYIAVNNERIGKFQMLLH
jgi:hypothetical protein